MVGNIELYQKGKMYNKDTISLLVHFATYYTYDEIPLNTAEPLFLSRRKVSGGKTKSRWASAIILDPANPTNNLWHTLADAKPFISRAKSAAEQLSR